MARDIAAQGHYPAIDIEQSISRVMHNVTDARQMREARDIKAMYSSYQRNRDLLAVGAYVPGSDAQADMAIRLYPQVAAFLQQDMREGASLAQSTGAMHALVAQGLTNQQIAGALTLSQALNTPQMAAAANLANNYGRNMQSARASVQTMSTRLPAGSHRRRR